MGESFSPTFSAVRGRAAMKLRGLVCAVKKMAWLVYIYV